ncbi:MAG: Lrp/AsnC ligand binding domain-containing protein [Flavobacteriaceae bacterium]|nr:Lrp/AsnC ligand binding domain-containing protein [Flavobacteriaceae bacterium]
MGKKTEIDGIDKTILRALMKDARTPVLEIARAVGISGAAIHQRLRKLENSGLISGSKFVINSKALGYTTMAFVGIFLDKAKSNSDAIKQLKRIPQVLECHYTTGNWSVLIKILCKDNEHLMSVLNKEIQTISGVSRTETFISLDQQIDRQIKI